jgi:hypothetical protein
MKKKIVLLTAAFLILVMMFPVVAADLTGYIPAAYKTQWDLADWGTWKGTLVEDGVRYWKHITVENVGTETLTEAKARFVVSKIWIWDGSGWVPCTDPLIIDNMVTVLNGEKIGARMYVVDLGTIQPGHTRKALLNVWCSEPLGFQFVLSVWILA